MNDGNLIETLELPSEPETLGAVVAALEAVAARHGLSESLVEEVAIALSEAVNNAIFHGNAGVSERLVFVRFYLSEDMLEILVRDQGKGFDLEAVPDPLAEENLLKPSGRGILMMRSLMDAVDFEIAGNGTAVTMRKDLNAPEDEE